MIGRIQGAGLFSPGPAPFFCSMPGAFHPMSLKEFVGTLPDYAKDLRLNLGSILSDQLIAQESKLALLLSCAHGSGYRPLVEATEAEVAGKLPENVATAARGAAALMAMNNVYYRFVHLVTNPEYGTMPARLRMNLIGSHGIAKDLFELMSLAVSAMNGCGKCIDSHERVLLEHGVRPDEIQSAARIAAVMKAIATVHAAL
jgi:alkyl hydroperoxide reductase subunit D